jgi:hypothetical protein
MYIVLHLLVFVPNVRFCIKTEGGEMWGGGKIARRSNIEPPKINEWLGGG